MRAYEFLTEQNHEQSARDALITILVTNHALGIERIATEQLARSLEERNFFVDGEWINKAVQEIPVVDTEKTTPSHVVLRSTEIPSDSEGEEASELDIDKFTQDSVDKMAKRALAKRSK